MVTTCLFDLDQTLVALGPHHREVLNKSIIKVAGPKYIVQVGDYAKMEGLPTKTKLNLLSQYYGLPTCLHSKIQALKQEMTISVIEEKITPAENVTEVLEYLQTKNYKIGIVSNSVLNTIRAVMDVMDISRYIDLYVSNECVLYPKPSPCAYLYAMSRLNAVPAQTLVFEDHPRGIRAAQLAGANVCEVRNPDDLTLSRVQEFIEIYS